MKLILKVIQGFFQVDCQKINMTFTLYFTTLPTDPLLMISQKDTEADPFGESESKDTVVLEKEGGQCIHPLHEGEGDGVVDKESHK